MDLLSLINSEKDIEKLKEISLEHIDNMYRNKKCEANQADIYEFILGSIDLSTNFEYCENPKVSIVIPVKNNFIMTSALLQSIKKNTKGIDYEVIIADDNSEDEVSQIEYFFGNLKRIVNDTGCEGFIYNMNNAISKARGEYIFSMNNDMMTLPDYLGELLKVIENDKSIGIAGSKTLNIENCVDECGMNITRNLEFKSIGQNEPSDFNDDKDYIDCDYCSGCAILFRRDVFEKAGKFDVNLAPAYFDDSDFAFNLKYNFGLKSVCVPKSKIYHFKGISYLETEEKLDLSRRNSLYFFQKWRNQIR